MGRHRRRNDDIDTPDGRLPDGDVLLTPGYARWSDLVTRHQAPVLNPDPPAELVRPYVTAQRAVLWWRS